jgi:hypothetical protein
MSIIIFCKHFLLQNFYQFLCNLEKKKKHVSDYREGVHGFTSVWLYLQRLKIVIAIIQLAIYSTSSFSACIRLSFNCEHFNNLILVEMFVDRSNLILYSIGSQMFRCHSEYFSEQAVFHYIPIGKVQI